MSLSRDVLKISPLVARALKENRPVVSLESTIISHGMPYPDNKRCALQVEQILRDRGVEPATIAIMNHKICIGLTHDEIQELAQRGSESRKVSRRDIPYVLAQGGLGSTTVAGTMICSALANIEIFVTGGLGGVHRGYEETMDVSADLRELGRTPVTVVSAGVKNILDIPRTLEYLQTQGVPVVTYGSKYFPAFFAPSSGIASPLSLDKIEDIAQMLLMRKKLALQNGVLVAVPNQDTENGEKIAKAIQQALKEADEQHIRGAATTPFLLKRVHTLTEGASIKTNIALVKHNAEVGASLALAYYQRLYSAKNTQFFSQKKLSQPTKGKLIVIGGCALDSQVTVQGKIQLYQSCRGKWKTSFGGVGRNISETASRLGIETIFITALASDSNSHEIRQNIQSYGIKLNEVQVDSMKAPTFLSILDDNKDSIISISDMDINQALTLSNIRQSFFSSEQKNPNPNDIVVIDANVEVENKNLLEILKYLNDLGYFIVFECKGKKSDKPAIDKAYEYISLLKMNEGELDIFLDGVRKHGESIEKGSEYVWLAKNIGSKSKNKVYQNVNAIITRGGQDITVVSKDQSIQSIRITKSNKVKKTTGAGDTLTGTLCSFLLRGENIQTALEYGIVASKMTIESQGKLSVICDELNLCTLDEQFKQTRAEQVV